MPEHRMPLSTTVLWRLQAERNRQTRGLRYSFASHRERMMQLIQSAGRLFPGSGRPSITILGAGNCLDLDLKALSGQFDVVRLVDIDRSAVEDAVQAQLGIIGSIHTIAPVDVAAPLVSLDVNDVASAADCESVCRQLAQTLSVPPTEPADVVVSACVLSQIMESLTQLIPADHPAYLDFLQALRRGHLRRMRQLMTPTGCGVFVSDLVSSESAPALSATDDARLPGFLAECLQSANFFSGLNPGLVVQDLKTEPGLAEFCRNVQIHPPWRWQMGPRWYAVYAVDFRATLLPRSEMTNRDAIPP